MKTINLNKCFCVFACLCLVLAMFVNLSVSSSAYALDENTAGDTYVSITQPEVEDTSEQIEKTDIVSIDDNANSTDTETGSDIAKTADCLRIMALVICLVAASPLVALCITAAVGKFKQCKGKVMKNAEC